jgi:hypothetical protein
MLLSFRAWNSITERQDGCSFWILDMTAMEKRGKPNKDDIIVELLSRYQMTTVISNDNGISNDNLISTAYVSVLVARRSFSRGSRIWDLEAFDE